MYFLSTWNKVIQFNSIQRLSQYVLLEIHKLWESYFLSKYSKFHMDFKNSERNTQKVFCFLDKCFWIACVKFSLLRKEYLSSAVNVLQGSPKVLHISKSNFFQINFLLLLCRFQQCLGPFTMFLFQGSSERGLFKHLPNHVFCSPYFKKYISYEGRLFFKMFQISSRFQKSSEKLTNSFLVFKFLHFSWFWQIFPIMNRTLIIGSQCVSKQS